MKDEGVRKAPADAGVLPDWVAERDQHPAPVDLFEYQQGLLSPEQEDLIRDHLADCADCTSMVLELAGVIPPTFPEARPEISPERLEANWQATIAKLWLPALRPRRLFDRVALPLAAGLLLTTLGAAYWGWRSSERLALALREPIVNVAVRDLLPDDTDGTFREEGAGPAPDHSSGPELLILNVADTRGLTRFRAEISPENEPHHLLWASDGLERSPAGRFTVSLPASFLPAGRYRVRLLGLNETTREVLAEYRLDRGPTP